MAVPKFLPISPEEAQFLVSVLSDFSDRAGETAESLAAGELREVFTQEEQTATRLIARIVGLL